ncbi:P44/Msp2 family outer membrane protein [Wolbachia endosymbiont of Ctenocephalides felis wCfeJ]|uniref:P44/Msp2 family outer membrane protein n=1 Tax=Wolbachia endosymbiont of Ctenocephalides felis wCfeJ TaxID=2732594 RepID=UPI001444BB98|nr:P44/Msp2 family outer membrane protein [Wolbachia endosymbiont of Ctenocephalides felis wCfeJ]WCR57536.1 MAG: Major surface antigen 4 [Wolbachia endosymbiont of Ctenocephalides felis wCfeJ]
MSNKKTLAIAAFALLLSQQSFACDTEGFYFGSGYYGQFFNSMSSLKVETKDITHASIKDGTNPEAKGQLLDKYKSNYNPLFAPNVAFGYEGKFGDNSYRAELEGIYSSVKVDGIGLGGNKADITYQKKFKTGTEGSEQDKTYGYGIKVDNDKIENISVMANAYYYWKNDDFSFSPYVGAGVGATRMKMFGQTSIRPAYQLRAGLDYSINENVNMHIGYRHFGVIGGNLKLDTNALNEQESNEIKVFNKGHKPVSGHEKDSIEISRGLFATHGMEAGLTFHFASKA